MGSCASICGVHPLPTEVAPQPPHKEGRARSRSFAWEEPELAKSPCIASPTQVAVPATTSPSAESRSLSQPDASSLQTDGVSFDVDEDAMPGEELPDLPVSAAGAAATLDLRPLAAAGHPAEAETKTEVQQPSSPRQPAPCSPQLTPRRLPSRFLQPPRRPDQGRRHSPASPVLAPSTPALLVPPLSLGGSGSQVAVQGPTMPVARVVRVSAARVASSRAPPEARRYGSSVYEVMSASYPPRSPRTTTRLPPLHLPSRRGAPLSQPQAVLRRRFDAFLHISARVIGATSITQVEEAAASGRLPFPSTTAWWVGTGPAFLLPPPPPPPPPPPVFFDLARLEEVARKALSALPGAADLSLAAAPNASEGAGSDRSSRQRLHARPTSPVPFYTPERDVIRPLRRSDVSVLEATSIDDDGNFGFEVMMSRILSANRDGQRCGADDGIRQAICFPVPG